MKKRKATRLETTPLVTKPISYVFITITQDKIYVLTYRYVWQIEYCPGGVIDAAKTIRKYIAQSDGEKVFVYAVSEKTLAIGRINRLTLQGASSQHNKHVVNKLAMIYNWLHGHSLECFTCSKLPVNIYHALDYHINTLTIQK